MQRILVMVSAILIAACGGGDSSSSTVSAVGWSIPVAEVVEGGPDPDDIPNLTQPEYTSVATTDLAENQLVFGVSNNGEIKTVPLIVMDYHEVLNDIVGGDRIVLSHSPLTGSSVAWRRSPSGEPWTFGVSGLLYNSNLILFDRATDSHWSQMLQEAVEGGRLGERAESLQVLETTLATWRKIDPETDIVDYLRTGWDYDYKVFPYGSYKTNSLLLFPVSSTDNRLSAKTRVIGLLGSGQSRVYQIDNFDVGIQVLNQQFSDESVVVVGSSDANFGMIFKRTLSDGTTLNFTAVQDSLPVVMVDDEGNTWDIFGRAVSGVRTGATLGKTNSYTAYWFAWVAFFPDAEIYF